MILSLDLFNANLKIPFVYSGDGLLHSELIKSVLDNGWYLNNKFTGAPYSQEMFDFPFSDALLFTIIKIIGLIFNDYALTLNIFYLLGYILSSITAMIVLRHFKVSYWPSLMVSILFAFLPYHFLRLYHLHLSEYFMIPLIVMVIIWSCRNGEIIFFKNNNDKLRFKIKSRIAISSIIICLLTASSGVYYAFFACALLGICLVFSLFLENRIQRVISIILLIVTICFGILINISPTLINNAINGKNVETASRAPADSDMYGLKISHLIIPSTDHGIEIVKKIKDRFIQYPLSSEGSAYIGLFGVLGFCLLLLWLIKPKLNNYKGSILDSLALLNISAILLATVGGFGSLFALVISPQIRAYNRISVFIAFISLFALGIIFDYLLKKYKRSKLTYSTIVFFICLIITIGMLDQTDKLYIPNYKLIEEEFKTDGDFIKNIEEQLAPNSMIFQLPYVAFPESPPINRMTDYEHFKGYLHSDTLRWSYGSMKGRSYAEWLKDVSQQNTEVMIEKLSFAGFSGIYIDRFAYEDGGAAIEKELTKLLNQQPLESNNNRRIFYNLSSYNIILKSKYSNDELNNLESNLVYPVLFEWKSSSLEGTKENNWRWLSNEAELEVNNTSDVEKEILIEMGLETGFDESSSLRIESDLLNDSIEINSLGNLYYKKIKVPPGKHIISFYSDAKRIEAPLDTRVLIFKVTNFHWSVIN